MDGKNPTSVDHCCRAGAPPASRYFLGNSESVRGCPADAIQFHATSTLLFLFLKLDLLTEQLRISGIFFQAPNDRS